LPPKTLTKHSKFQYKFLSILPSPDPQENTVTFSISYTLYCPCQILTTNTTSSARYSLPQALTKTQ
jgi:hypothetical protein